MVIFDTLQAIQWKVMDHLSTTSQNTWIPYAKGFNTSLHEDLIINIFSGSTTPLP
jgi:hypothetical protein